jgi:SAM-dependent methyltransferase
MSHESSKSIFHKIKDHRYATRWLKGHGIDVGAGADSIGHYREFFPLMTSCTPWDMPQGDAQLLEGALDQSFDWVHSSHCLEHMRDPLEALNNWLRVLKPGGHLICLVPDEDLYEQGLWPSRFNTDHKHTFTIYKSSSWSPVSHNLTELLTRTSIPTQIIKLELMDSTYRYQLNEQIGLRTFDQTQTPVGECAIEFVLKRI